MWQLTKLPDPPSTESYFDGARTIKILNKFPANFFDLKSME